MTINEIIDSVVNLVNNYNSTGAATDISAGLSRRVEVVTSGSPDFGQIATKFPCVFVRANTYDQEISTLGLGAKRKVDFQVDVFPCTQVGYGIGAAESEAECSRLTENLHQLFRSKTDLSTGSQIWVTGMNTVFNEEYDTEVYTKVNRITLVGGALE